MIMAICAAVYMVCAVSVMEKLTTCRITDGRVLFKLAFPGKFIP